MGGVGGAICGRFESLRSEPPFWRAQSAAQFPAIVFPGRTCAPVTRGCSTDNPPPLSSPSLPPLPLRDSRPPRQVRRKPRKSQRGLRARLSEFGRDPQFPLTVVPLREGIGWNARRRLGLPRRSCATQPPNIARKGKCPWAFNVLGTGTGLEGEGCLVGVLLLANVSGIWTRRAVTRSN
jgi:hypothetical protein